MEAVPNTFKSAIILPVKAHWKATSDKEVASLKNGNVYTLVPTTAVPTRPPTLVGCTRSRLTNPIRGKLLCSDRKMYQASTAEAHLLRSAGFRASVWCWR